MHDKFPQISFFFVANDNNDIINDIIDDTNDNYQRHY